MLHAPAERLMRQRRVYGVNFRSGYAVALAGKSFRVGLLMNHP